MKTKTLLCIIILFIMLFTNCVKDHSEEQMLRRVENYTLSRVITMDDGDSWDMKQCDSDCNFAHFKNKTPGKHSYTLVVVYDFQDGTGQHTVSGNYEINIPVGED